MATTVQPTDLPDGRDAVAGIKASAARLQAAARRLDAAAVDLDHAGRTLARLNELEVEIARLGLPRPARRRGR